MLDEDMILISDPRIWGLPVKGCSEPLVDLRQEDFLVIGARMADLNPSYTYVRESVAEKLREASSYLPEEVQFLFEEGHRPISVQRKFFTEYSDELRQKHPEWPEDTIYKEATKLVAPPEDVPPHFTGAAVDITLIDVSGHEMDMGAEINASPHANENRNYTMAENISEIGRKNRNILIDVMRRVGFVNYPTEWWHWSYGDKYWAYHTESPAALFASVEV